MKSYESQLINYLLFDYLAMRSLLHMLRIFERRAKNKVIYQLVKVWKVVAVAYFKPLSGNSVLVIRIPGV